jgi:hypothetical protein
MENQTRFDLNAAIENWRNELAAQPNLAPDDRRELETHLRDSIAGFQQRGLNDEESFKSARGRVGQLPLVGKEFGKVGSNYWNKPMVMMAWVIFAASLILPAYNELSERLIGYKCLEFVLPWRINGIPYSGPGDSLFGWQEFINWKLLNFANLLMITSPILFLWFGQNSRFLKWFRYSAFTALILIGWFVLDEIVKGTTWCLNIGCYIWILSFVMLYLSTFSQFVSRRNRRKLKHA